jgi:N-acyl-D-amino-acid deacylase
MSEIDLVVRGGLVVDGSGGESFEADVAVADGRIVQIGKIAARGREEIDARGHVVTPGFVDIHTHYDGQATWEDRTDPSAKHGVTTVVMGNCGVGFAPCKPEDRERLIYLMEGVEDIPEAVMVAGIPWKWETFPEYLDFLATRHRDVDIAAQLPHSCLRVYVMGQRAVDREPATADDLARMTQLSREAMEAGAIGFTTSLTLGHAYPNGARIPSYDVAEQELHAIAQGLRQANTGVLQAVFDFNDLEGNFGLFRRLAERSGRPLSYTLSQQIEYPEAWREALKLTADANRDGVEMKAQMKGRPTSILLGLDVSFNPFSLHPTYQKLAHLSLKDKVAALRHPDVKAAILSEEPGEPPYKVMHMFQRFDLIFPLGDPPVYEPFPHTSVAAQAQKRGMSPRELAYDLMLENEGAGILSLALTNFLDGNLDASCEMLKDPNTLEGLNDGGAHYGMICDASASTFMLDYWTRRRDGEKLPLEDMVRRLSSAGARAVRLLDRGLIATGYKADLNVINYDRLKLYAPEMSSEGLPSGGRRLVQRADGYAATIVNGEVTYREGVPTGAMPGRLVRGEQARPV